MLHPDYPTADDLQAELEAAGLYDASWGLDLAGAVDTGREQFEKEADWGPFLTKSQVSNKRFTVDGTRSLFLKRGLAAKPTSVIVDGVELVEDETYWLEPANALDEGEPITRIKFARALRTRHQGVSITGRWGYCTQLPQRVWDAVLQNAALQLSGTIQQRYAESKVAQFNENAPVKAKESGPLRKEYAIIDGAKVLDLGKTFAAWRDNYAKTLADYMYKGP